MTELRLIAGTAPAEAPAAGGTATAVRLPQVATACPPTWCAHTSGID